MTGQAADITAQGIAPLNLARMALEEMGYNLGIGLGRTYIHVDLRGTLATWVYPDAGMGAQEFRDWVLNQCR